MANRPVNELDDMWVRMRGLVAKYDVKIITATAPRQRPSMPHIENDIVIIDYIGQVKQGSHERNRS